MPHIGKVKLGLRPTVCAVLQEHASAKILKKLKESHIQLVEVRIDKLSASKIDLILKTLKSLKKAGFSIIGTIRIKQEGGHFSGSEKNRLEIFQKIIRSVDAVDIELRSAICKTVIKLAKKNRKSAIVSFHDFSKTLPSKNLLAVLKKSKKTGADIIKIAVTAKTREDFVRMMDFLVAHRNENLIAVSMGKIGSISRLAFPFLGSLLSYGFVEKSSAPGQLSIQELNKTLFIAPK